MHTTVKVLSLIYNTSLLCFVDFALSVSNSEYVSSPSISPSLQLSQKSHAYSRVTSSATTNSLTVDNCSWKSMSATPQNNMKQMQTSTLLIGGTPKCYMLKYTMIFESVINIDFIYTLGISASVVILLLVFVSAIICLTMCFIIRTHRKQETGV